MKNTNQINIPEAREAMDKFKMEAANEVGGFHIELVHGLASFRDIDLVRIFH